MQVSQLESLITFKGNRVAEKEVGSLIDKLMNLLVKLDAVIVSDGELKTQRGNLVYINIYNIIFDSLRFQSSHQINHHRSGECRNTWRH